MLKYLVFISALFPFDAKAACKVIVKLDYQAVKCDHPVPVFDELANLWEFSKKQLFSPVCRDEMQNYFEQFWAIDKANDVNYGCGQTLVSATVAVAKLAPELAKQSIEVAAGETYFIVEEGQKTISRECKLAKAAVSQWTSRPECFAQPPKKPVRLADKISDSSGNTYLYDYASTARIPYRGFHWDAKEKVCSYYISGKLSRYNVEKVFCPEFSKGVQYWYYKTKKRCAMYKDAVFQEYVNTLKCGENVGFEYKWNSSEGQCESYYQGLFKESVDKALCPNFSLVYTINKQQGWCEKYTYGKYQGQVADSLCNRKLDGSFIKVAGGCYYYGDERQYKAIPIQCQSPLPHFELKFEDSLPVCYDMTSAPKKAPLNKCSYFDELSIIKNALGRCYRRYKGKYEELPRSVCSSMEFSEELAYVYSLEQEKCYKYLDGQYSETNLIDCGDRAMGGSVESYTISTEDLLTSQQGSEWELTELPYVNGDASSPRKALYNNGQSGFFYSSPLKVEPGQSIKLDMDMALWFRVGSETAQFYSKPSLVEFEFERLSSCGSNASVENTENILSYKADAMATSGQRLLVFSNDFADVMKQQPYNSSAKNKNGNAITVSYHRENGFGFQYKNETDSQKCVRVFSIIPRYLEVAFYGLNATYSGGAKDDALMSLEDLDIQMGTGQSLDQNTMDIIAENGMEIDQTCQWAQLPFRYQFEEGVVYINSAKTMYNFFSYDVVKSRRCSVKNARLSNGALLFDRESASTYILNSKAQVARDFAVTSKIEEKLARCGTQVTQNCQFAARPFIYRFEDGYVYLPQNRSVARIYPTSSVPVECRTSDNIRMQL